MGSFSSYPGVYHVRNRTRVIVITVIILTLSFFELFNVVKAHSPPVFTLFWIIFWSFMLLVTVSRRLVINEEGLEYSNEARTLRVKWSEVKYIEKRRKFVNLYFPTEGLVIRTDLPDAKEHFVDLTQFGGALWRTKPLGTVLQMKAPHLFKNDSAND